MWCKRGLVFDEPAQLPTLEDRNDCIRVYYSFRIDSKSYINYFEMSKTFKVTYKNKKPVMTPGPRGSFDDSGVMSSCLNNGLFYYTGWNQCVSVPYGHSIGVAKFNESTNQFERLFDYPVLDRGRNVPFLANSPFVLDDKMWFCNGTGWDGDFPTYGIASAELRNLTWMVNKDFIVGTTGEAYSRPFVGHKKLVYSKRTKDSKYSIFEYSDNKEEEILRPSNEGWDSEMVCYPFIWNNFMFYNGNNYGTSGIGCAEWI